MASDQTPTAAELELSARAIAAADEVLAEMAGVLPPELEVLVRAGLAIAWIEGRQSGADEARTIIDGFLAELRRTVDAP